VCPVGRPESRRWTSPSPLFVTRLDCGPSPEAELGRCDTGKGDGAPQNDVICPTRKARRTPHSCSCPPFGHETHRHSLTTTSRLTDTAQTIHTFATNFYRSISGFFHFLFFTHGLLPVSRLLTLLLRPTIPRLLACGSPLDSFFLAYIPGTHTS